MSTDKGKLAVMLGRKATAPYSYGGGLRYQRERWYICPGKFLPGFLF